MLDPHQSEFGRMASPTEILAVDRPRHIRTRFGNRILKGESDVRFVPEGQGEHEARDNP